MNEQDKPIEERIHSWLMGFGGGEYLFRGQSNSNWSVASTLQRAFSESDNERSLPQLEKSVLAAAQYRIWPHTPKLEALAELRHMGGMANYIDFTRSVHVAVYYACLNDPQVDGAVYFLKSKGLPVQYPFEFGPEFCKEIGMTSDANDSALTIATPGVNPVNFSRVIMQESVFIQAENGCIDRDRFYRRELIKAEDKKAALAYLEKQALMSHEILFGDVIALVEKDRLCESRDNQKEDMQLKLDQYDDLKKEAEQWKAPVVDIPYSDHPLIKALAHLGYPHYRLGRISYSRGNYDEAKSEFLTALDKGCREPVQSKVRVNLASTYLHLKQFKEALKCLEETKHYNYEEVCHFMAAEAHFRMGNYQDAWDRISKAVDMNRWKLTYLRLKAAAAFKLGLFAEAKGCANLYLSYMYDRQLIALSHKVREAKHPGANPS